MKLIPDIVRCSFVFLLCFFWLIYSVKSSVISHIVRISISLPAYDNSNFWTVFLLVVVCGCLPPKAGTWGFCLTFRCNALHSYCACTHLRSSSSQARPPAGCHLSLRTKTNGKRLNNKDGNLLQCHLLTYYSPSLFSACLGKWLTKLI